MTIAYWQYEAIGGRQYAPEGPFGAAGQSPLPNFRPGEVVGGDGEGEFVYLLFSPAAAVTVNQGDWLTWDATYQAVLTPVAATGSLDFNVNVGTFFLGGRVGDPAAAPSAGNAWSFTFPTAGVYGIWVQRSGTSLMKLTAITSQGTAIRTSATAGALAQATVATAMGITGAGSAAFSHTFTANTTNGSTLLTGVTTAKALQIGATVSGTGITNGSVITDIQGSTVTISIAATATNTGTTITVLIGGGTASTYCTTTNNSPILTNVTSIAGLYPNQSITGTGIGASAVIVSITGNNAPYTITASVNSTATANNIALTASGYYEGYLRWPYVNQQY